MDLILWPRVVQVEDKSREWRQGCVREWVGEVGMVVRGSRGSRGSSTDDEKDGPYKKRGDNFNEDQV